MKYKDREGHCNVSNSHKENGENLGTGLNKQHSVNKEGKLNIDKIKRLDDIGVVWSFRK